MKSSEKSSDVILLFNCTHLHQLWKKTYLLKMLNGKETAD